MQLIIKGYNSYIKAKRLVKGNVLLITKLSIYTRYKDKVDDLLSNSCVTSYTGVIPNPDYKDIKRLVRKYKNKKFDLIIAFGGGSSIDFAKGYKYNTNRDIPLMAIPTTAGSGSESTQIAVVYENHKKLSLTDKSLLPNYVILDAIFTKDASRYTKGCCAADAISQAIESYWANKATPISKRYAINSLKLCSKYIRKAVNTNDIKSNQMMLLASNYAGKAINISRTTASHALAYFVTIKYNLPHGHAVALTIPKLYKLNSNVFDSNKINKILNINSNNMDTGLFNIFKDIGINISTKELKISNIKEICKSVNLDKLDNNPVKLDLSKLISLYF